MSAKSWIVRCLMVSLLGGASVFAAEQVDAEASPFPNDDAKYSYVLGVQFAKSLKSQTVAKIDVDMVARAMRDILDDKPALMTDQQIQEAFQEFRQKAMEAARAQREAQAQSNLTAGKEFLEKNKTREGVHVTPSGLQYEIVREGTGKSPDANDQVKAHYRGTLIDGTEFDSSYKRGQPATFALNRVIKGWTEGLQLMKEGAKYKFYIPAELGYGPRGSRSIPGNSVLIFEVELLEVIPQEPSSRAARPARPPAQAGSNSPTR